MIFVIGVSTPIVSHLYDPSRRYMKKNRSNLRQSLTFDLRLLVCIHGQENVPTIINLLEASNPTKASPVSVFVLQLSEINGLTAASVLAPVNQQLKSEKLTRSERIVNAFKYFERHSQGPVVVQHFTAIAPYASMHNDICNLALDNKTSIVILPYHKQQAIDGTVEANSPSIRSVNQNVILKAPCSVGVLVDRSRIDSGGGGRSVLSGQSLYRLVMLYIGGADDREALEYSKRMAGHPNISLTVVWLKEVNKLGNSEKQNIMDNAVMREFRAMATGKDKIVYREENVKDGIRTTQMIRSMEDHFDLFIVGRRHDPDSRITLGLTEWSECPELGIIGDMLATSDFQFSVLVMQQG